MKHEFNKRKHGKDLLNTKEMLGLKGREGMMYKLFSDSLTGASEEVRKNHSHITEIVQSAKNYSSAAALQTQCGIQAYQWMCSNMYNVMRISYYSRHTR